jgi:class 3 adenylate cyclase
MASFLPFLPLDRCHALASGTPLPDRTRGAALFADVSGFTALTGALAAELGGKRGAEELLRHLNGVYEALIAVIHAQGGGVVGFAGDSITCWFDERPAGREGVPAAELRAATAAARLHEVLRALPEVRTPRGVSIPLGIKVAVAAGGARRFLVGDPAQSRLDTLAGSTIERMAALERQAAVGETVVDDAVGESLAGVMQLGERRPLPENRGAAFVMSRLERPAADTPWPPLPAGWCPAESAEWVLPAVRERVISGGEFLGELRPAVPLFIGFEGIQWDDDPEAGARLDGYVRWAQGVLGALGGAAIQLTIGDKGSNLYAAFGTPVAHEDDADRACAAALSLAAPPPALGYITGIRIGMSQGPVWSGACGSAERRCYGVMGDPVNLAARLMVRARDGEILAEERLIRAAARHRFTATETVSLKGRATPVALATLAGREERPAPRGHTPSGDLVGRREELGRILSLLPLVRGGGRHAVLLEGEAGIGKSRLAAAVAVACRDAGLPTLSGSADAVERGRAYHAWRGVFAELLPAPDTGDVEAHRARILGRLATLDPDLQIRAPLLEAVLPLGWPETALTAQMDAAVRAENTRDLLVRLLAGLTGGPFALLLEDAHWFDSASWALLAELRRSRTPSLLVVACRPLDELAREGPLSPEVEELRSAVDTLVLQLDVLSPEDAVALACARLGVMELPPRIARLITERAEGNPLYVEELAQAMVESGLVRIVDGRCELAGAAADSEAELTVPATIEGLVTSRLDRLAPATQRTAKVASVIGRVFAYRTLDGIYPVAQERSALPHALDELERLDITRHATAAEPSYAFKHAVTHEVVYGTLLFAQRQELHRAVAGWYETTYAADLDPYFPLLAHHWERAEAPAEAVAYGERAGDQALRSYANREAAAFFARVLAGLERGLGLPPASPAARRLRRARALRRLAQATFAIGDVPAAARHLTEALELLGRPMPRSAWRRAGLLAAELSRQAWHRLRPGWHQLRPPTDRAERVETAAALGALILTYFYTGDLFGAVAANFRALNLAETATAGPELARELTVAYANVAAVFGNAFGMHRVAARYYARGEAVAREAGHLPATGYLEQIRGVVSLLSGRISDAAAPLERATAIFERLGDRRRWEECSYTLGTLHLLRGELEPARRVTEALVGSSRLRESTQALMLGLAQLGQVRLLQGAIGEAIAALEESRALHAREPYPAERICAMGVMALAHAVNRDRAAARARLEDVLTLTRRLPMSNVAVEGYAAACEAALLLLEPQPPADERQRLLNIAAVTLAALSRTARFAARVYASRRLRLSGALEMARGRRGAALRAWRAAAARADAAGLHLDEALAAIELARYQPDAEARGRSAARARELLTAAAAPWYLERLDNHPAPE